MNKIKYMINDAKQSLNVVRESRKSKSTRMSGDVRFKRNNNKNDKTLSEVIDVIELALKSSKRSEKDFSISSDDISSRAKKEGVHRQLLSKYVNYDFDSLFININNLECDLKLKIGFGVPQPFDDEMTEMKQQIDAAYIALELRYEWIIN